MFVGVLSLFDEHHSGDDFFDEQEDGSVFGLRSLALVKGKINFELQTAISYHISYQMSVLLGNYLPSDRADDSRAMVAVSIDVAVFQGSTTIEMQLKLAVTSYIS
jgi:hypothetical protein